MNPTPEIARRIERLVRRFPDDDLPLLVEMLVLLAYSTGRVDPDEQVAVAAGIESVMGNRLQPDHVAALVAELVDQLLAESVDLRALSVGHLLAERGRADDGLRLGIAVALASGALADAEQDLLGTVARAAGVSGTRLDGLIDKVREALAFDA